MRRAMCYRQTDRSLTIFMLITSDPTQKQIRKAVGRSLTVEDRARNMADLNLFIFQTTGLRLPEDQLDVIALQKIIQQNIAQP
jgi:hypothetical protein